MKHSEYEIVSCGKKYMLKKMIGQYNTKEEAAVVKRKLLREESEQRGKILFEEARTKGLSRYL